MSGLAAGVWTIGIDFGTAFSKAAAAQSAAPDSLAPRTMMPLHIGAVSQARRTLIVPSALFLNDRRIFFGPRAPEEHARVGDDRREMLQSFKTILGAHDFEAALDHFPSRLVDPDSAFTWRGLIVLYLAYLLEVVDRARPAEVGDLANLEAGAQLRYTRPGWMQAQAEAAHKTMVQLFDAAAQVRAMLGEHLLSGEGVAFEVARAALGAIREGEPALSVEGGIYEASAVAACHFVHPETPDHILVADIGAGTADFAGFARVAKNGAFREILPARRTVRVAGDIFDRVLMSVLLAKAKHLQTTKEKSAFWRALQADVRLLKEALCRDGQIQYRYQGEVIGCTLAEYQRNPDYRDTAAQLSSVYLRILREVAVEAKSAGARDVAVVLAGGGAHFPAVIDMVRKPARVEGLAVRVMPTAPDWSSDLNSEKEFAALFSQMCVAFGAAIADPRQFQSS